MNCTKCGPRFARPSGIAIALALSNKLIPAIIPSRLRAHT
jgi:hypothetical protein